ncbi:MAG: hypothetical protein H5U01_02450 [Clostridia bacterium]|nr:hypothetical protein [Clostridia bacterium]
MVVITAGTRMTSLVRLALQEPPPSVASAGLLSGSFPFPGTGRSSGCAHEKTGPG